MKKLFYILIVFLGVFHVSCETDIDVNAEYKDITLVYGLIDPADSNHYIKVNRAFLGEGNALDLAADADNFNYPADELTVLVEAYNDGALVNTYTATRTVNEIPKDNGIFDDSENVLYRFTEPAINRQFTYQLKIYNNALGKEITSETKIVRNPNIGTPSKQQKLALWIGNLATGTFADRIVNGTSGEDVGRLDATLVFKYHEHYTLASGLAPVTKTLTMSLGERQTTTTLGGETVEWEISGASFFDNISREIPAPNTVPFFSHRELDNVSFEINIAGTELNTFMLVSAPSTSVNQDKPKYTNVENGIGIFSSRSKYLWESNINPATGNINLNNETIIKLKDLGLGFCFGNSPTSNYECIQQ